jgi:CTP:molybdopterin cytidylyltransferase MocA
MPDLAIVILAAGGSRRLGEPKQLVSFRGEPLIRYLARTAAAFDADNLIVVVGGNACECVEALENTGVDIVGNPFWETGLASSIRLGVERAEARGAQAVLLLLADQPLLDSEIIAQYVERMTGKPDQIIAADHGAVIGPPMLFGSDWFSDLKTLEGDQGARHLVRARKETIDLVQWPDGSIDIDTPEDLKKLIKLSQGRALGAKKECRIQNPEYYE